MTVVLPARESSTIVTVPVTDDNILEGNEVFGVMITGVSMGTVFDDDSTVTIIDNDSK